MTINSSETEEKISIIENICVVHPRMTKIFTEFDHLRHDAKFAAEPSCMFLLGKSGAGKTTAINSYRKRTPVYVTEDGHVIPTFAASLPSPTTIKGVAERILQTMNAPKPGAGTTVSMTAKIVKLFKNCKVELILLDEFQHLLQRNSKKNFDEVSDWVKDLINISGLPLVMVGTPGSEEILKSNPQLERRVKATITLDSFDYQKHPKDFQNFLKVVDKTLPFDIKSRPLNLSDASSSSRIFLVSGGLPGYAMRIIREAAKLAVRAGSSQLREEHFLDTFELYFKGRIKCPNPWTLTAVELQKQLTLHYERRAKAMYS